ncbi:hypothetical protein A1O1_01210 [Capronia coronata CBS 617.96]|uniref:Uncharacterized protein n=1 Tax=Capronia coronata CBS 617.96 TaxID=1182541 RepID=W9ZNM6_9EURO|nr:uncharacterized protein A1O1_01210 [Capronia coronata CBS 617.96]EXJ96084.1 hypothetical protein A1O1_01210 [Capronia coronata CBS 617.96]
MQSVSRTKGPKKTFKRKDAGAAPDQPSTALAAPTRSRVAEPASSSGDGSEVSRLPAAPSSIMSSKEQFLLQHYFYTVSGILSSTHDRTINTYCRVVLPMAMSSNMLMDTLLLVSTSHLASRYEQFAVDLPHYRSRVLPRLIGRINSWDGFDPTMLATIIMMAINEIFEANPKNWSEHLRAAGRIISDYVAQCKEPDHDTRMLLDIFAYHNVLASVGANHASLVMDYCTRDTWSALAGHSNAFLASVDRLLSLVAKLSMLSSQSTDDAGARYIKPSQLPAANHLKAELENWQPPKAIPNDACNTAEAMRHAGLLFFYKLTSAPSPGDDRSGILRSCDEIVRHIGYVSIDSPAAASHLWPLYMAGCFLNKSNDDGSIHWQSQEFIRSRLSALKSKRGVKTVDRVRERLEQIWDCDDTEMVDVNAPLILV